MLSGMSERSFVTDRGCVNEMSLEWYGEEVQSFDGISHVHAAGYFNCQKLMTELPNYFREVCFILLIFCMLELYADLNTSIRLWKKGSQHLLIPNMTLQSVGQASKKYHLF